MPTRPDPTSALVRLSRFATRFLLPDERDDGRGPARAGGALFAVAGIAVLSSAWLLPPDVPRWPLVAFGGSAIAVGALVPSLPWERWSPRALLVLPLVAQMLLASGGWLAPGALEQYIGLYGLSFLFVGLTFSPGIVLALVPLALLSYTVGSRGDFEAPVALLMMVVVGAVAGEVVAETRRRHAAATMGVTRLLDATRRLGRAEQTESAAGVLVELAKELLASDITGVFMAEKPGSDRFVAWAQDDEMAAVGPLSVDVSTEQTGVGVALHTGETIFVADASASPIVSKRLIATTGVASIAFVPLPGRLAAIAVLVAAWRQPVPRLDGFRRQVIEVLSTEAGWILERLADTTRLNVEAESDPLTGLANRRHAERMLDVSEAGAAVVLIDVDHFKTVNDTHGHMLGDDVLRVLSDCLGASARDGDCVARYGGDEFLVVLPGAGEQGAMGFLGRLAAAWERSIPLTTYSAGIAIRAADESPTVTLGRADAAVYKAKAAGRNAVRIG